MSDSDEVLVYFKHETKPGRSSCIFVPRRDTLENVCQEYLNNTGIPNHEPFFESPKLLQRKRGDFSRTIGELEIEQLAAKKVKVTVKDDWCPVNINVIEPVEVEVNLVRTSKKTSERFFSLWYPTTPLEGLLNSIEFFKKLSLHDRNISINGEKIVLDQNMLVRDLSRHKRFGPVVVDVEPDPASFSLSLMMGTHPRLGQGSVISGMKEDLLRIICAMSATKVKGWKSTDSM